MLILGLNMFHADASAAIVQDGEIKFAIAEERLNRRKHFGGFPTLAVKACLDAVGAKISDVEHVAVGQNSDAHLARKVWYALSNPSKLLNFVRLRQRKESMRDLHSLLANGDRAFSKERIEVFGGGSTAVLEDFRRLELVREGRKETIHSRWRQDKGHRGGWDAFAQAVQRRSEAPIPFDELVRSTLATLRVDQSVAIGSRLAVDAASFLDAVRRTSSVNPSCNK